MNEQVDRQINEQIYITKQIKTKKVKYTQGKAGKVNIY